MVSVAMLPVKAGEVALMGPSEDRQRAVGTPDYLAPELLLGSRPFQISSSFDVGCQALLQRRSHLVDGSRRNRARPRG